MFTNKELSALLLLEDGMCFEGISFGAIGTISGEVVFNTGMTGYQEVITDPSYFGQLVTFTYPEIGSVGLSEEDAISIGKNVKISRFDIRGLGKAHADRTIEGFVKIVSNAEDDSILGMHIVSSHAADLVHEGVAAIKGGIKTGELGSMIHSHPTLSEGIMFAALS